MRPIFLLAFALVFSQITVPAMANGPWFKPALLLELEDPSMVAGGTHGSMSASDAIVAVGEPWFGYGKVRVYNVRTGPKPRTIQDPTPTEDDDFGKSVAVLGGLVIVGAPRDNAGAKNAGLVYVFDALSGVLRRRIANPSPEAGDKFGTSVAASENNLVVVTARAVHVFDLLTGERPRLTIPCPPGTDLSTDFNGALAVSGNLIAVGAARQLAWAGAPERVYVFDATNGHLLRTLSPPDQETEASFGMSLAADTGRILVGAPFASVGAFSSGAAYLFDALTGALIQRFRNPTPAKNECFGYSVALKDSNVLIGAPFVDMVVRAAGEAYLFDAASGTLAHTFTAIEGIACLHPALRDGETIGSSVAVTGEAAVIGTPRVQGVAAYVFHRSPVRLLRVMARSAGATVPGSSWHYGFAAFYVEGWEKSFKRGGDGKGRGFNVAAIEVTTGRLLDAIMNFDTWNDPVGQISKMDDFLNRQPNGTLLLIAVGDEAGLTESHLSPCVPRSGVYADKRAALIQALKALGSTLIDQYCYSDSWAMIAIKGEGKARAEQLGKGVEVCLTDAIEVP